MLDADNASIREFCDVTLPILMFDKKGDFSVLRLETVLPQLIARESDSSPTNIDSSSRYPSGRKPSSRHLARPNPVSWMVESQLHRLGR